MLDLFKKSMLLGMGMAVLTKEKADEMVGEVMKAGKVSRDEAEKFVNEMTEKSGKMQEYLKEYVQEYFDAYNKKVGIATKKEMDSLKKRVEELEEKIKKLEKK
mgnify:CR=1 FL=1